MDLLSRPIIAASGLTKRYGGKTLFEDATFQVHRGDKVALVGPNGAGKTTLLKILAGRERPDEGTLQAEATRTHWFEQHPEIPGEATVRDLLRSERVVPPALLEEKKGLDAKIADPALYEQSGYESVLERYGELEREIDMASAPPPLEGGILSQLGFTEKEMERKAAQLSGGEKTRVLLARTLMDVRDDDLVVLDEPTNHLDVDSIEWLETWIDEHPGTVLVVAHDRVFLDNVAKRVFEVAQGKIRTYTGNYEDYAEARDEEQDRERRDHERAKQRMQQAKGTILQFRHQKRFDGQYASRMKQLDKYQAALERTAEPIMQDLGFGLQFDAVGKSSDEMVHAKALAKSYGDDPVLRGVDLEIRKGDRIGLVGGNGSGKTTLLKLLTGRLPADSGTIRAAPAVKGIFVHQELDDLDPARTLHEEVLDARATLEERDVKALVGRFRFHPEVDLTRKVATLSGGERQRLMILKSVLKPSNLLILDEPTNHLDLYAREVVIQALSSYQGTLLVVSHDRFLLDAVTQKTAVLQEGTVQVYPGSYTETRDLHHRGEKKTARRTRKYLVRKKFTDWASHTKHRAYDELELTDEEVQENRSYKNALSQGWMERV